MTWLWMLGALVLAVGALAWLLQSVEGDEEGCLPDDEDDEEGIQYTSPK